ncbi:hypothetical protein [Variovorax soli]|uniref:Cobalt transporter CbtA n=1 Tax=Variovorax soli TaxID=376815 RepID=A0ABU1NM14_9BURK|nr:hypothetical protein [Variovorax soli]MDR6539479.1 putative cobalt transporter CbtA [Variovorax soli]
MQYLLWGVVFFFALAWTLGLVLSPAQRIKSNIVAVMYWWIAIALASASAFSPWHLLWLMPLALFLSMRLMLAELARTMNTSVSSVFIKSGMLMGPILTGVVYWS